MDTKQIENNLVDSLVKKIQKDGSFSEVQLESLIMNEIKSVNYIKEDWQIPHAKEDIKGAIFLALNLPKTKIGVGRTILNLILALLISGFLNTIFMESDGPNVGLILFIIFFLILRKITISSLKNKVIKL